MTTTDPASDSTAQRKDDHIRLAMEQHSGETVRDYDHVRFVHHALAGGSRDTVDVSSPAFGWSAPFYVSGMTGGTAKAAEINRGLGIVARETGIPVACGSMGIVLRQPEVAPTFTVLREANPDGFVMANTNANVSGADAARIVEIMGADALQVHVNAAQETAMPEGDRDFSRWEGNIAAIIDAVGVPVIVKEVGAGLSRGTVAALRDIGVGGVDLAGRGGTDFGAIESARRTDSGRHYLAGWGQSSVASLLETAGLDGVGSLGPVGDGGAPRAALLASGGVRHPLDVVRALALGADAVGVAGTFLKVLTTDGEDALIALVREWLTEIADLMALLGTRDVAGLRTTDVLVTGPLREYAELRGFDVTAYARRGPWSRV
ncbi:type 2 isopentenyl-diphosphate Delta-isomerase [Serinibacter arcticus]|uniref:Isopentenyl-diphosphate delta-isomerase n=1 Tax=Serinibacter arcticus TaxID=1655435 RepID=A0A2U2A024_9MICO|nr:type 2 isopentenyl-diphosphate Delta-isomerase [Serinibacter arcticus]PWD52587.1 type 2 isopentenyl-diphosphate Delta-isomerase [Serinibacter arcticus]